MKAMIFAAGLGSRLGEITKSTPKCLVQVNGKTLLEYVIERLQAAGVDSVMINLHYLSDKIVDFISRRGDFGLKVEYSREDKLLGTGGGLRKVHDFFSKEKNFYVHNSDVYSDVDLVQMRKAHEANGALATLAVMRRDTARYLLFDRTDNLCGWMSSEGEKLISSLSERPANAQKMGFSGIQIISPGFFRYLQSNKDEFSIITSYLEAAAAGQRISAYSIDHHFWLDVGKPETLAELKRKLSAS